MYLIDGHNLIAHVPGLSLDDPHDEAKLVERLKSAMGRRRQRCVVIFDAGLPGGLSRDLSTSSVTVIFAHAGTTADAIILERIRNARDPGSLIVVSADREIVTAAARRPMRVIRPAEFAATFTAPKTPHDDTPDVRLTPGEVDEWLRLFGGEPDDE
jgi:hypothetical protein